MTKLTRITINLADEQVSQLPPAPTLTARVLLKLGFDVPERGSNFKRNNPRKKKCAVLRTGTHATTRGEQ